MYTVLVVDDEELICLGIKSMIERLGHPRISNVSIAASADDAVESIRSSGPDIVITDIQMPGTNGLEMIRSMMHKTNGIKFVVLSGYDDFKYAREALKLGVMDYLLKPASMPELKNVLDNAVSALDLDRRSGSAEQELKYRQLLLENNLRKLFMYKSLDDFNVRNILDRIGAFFPFEAFTIGILNSEGSSGMYTEDPGAAGADNAGDGISAGGAGWQTVGFMSGNTREVCVLNHIPAMQHSAILSVFKDKAVEAKERWGSNPAVAVSTMGSGIESLLPLFRQAEKALAYRLIDDGAAVIEYGAFKDRRVDSELADRKLNDFNELLKLRKEEQLSCLVDSLFCRENLANQSIDYASRLFNGINRQLVSSAATGLQNTMEESIRPFESFANLQSIRIYLKERIHQVVAALKEEDLGNQVMAGVMSNIRRNMGGNISLATAASQAGISYAHFSRLFKKRAGMNFSEYLMKVRMEEAKRLLVDPALKIYEIASKVGYGDPKHFTRAFRLFYGVSPMECRSKTAPQDAHDKH